MIPILYEHNETVFTSNGLGRLPDCVSCTVIEERNGVFEVELVYPITGLHYADLQEDRIICVTHDEQKDIQPFEIYARSAPINGLVTFYAHHISYRLSGIICQPVDGASVSAVFSEISAKSMSTNPFTFWTDNTTAGNLGIIEPRSVRAILGGQRGSILDVFGGEYEFDRFTVKNYAHRGTDNGVTIRYGKNLLDLTQDYSTLSVYNAIVPFWASMDGTVVYGGIVSQAGASEIIARAVDYSQDFQQTQPTVAQLEAKAAADLASKQPWTPSENIAIDFVALWQTEEYKYIANLERVQLCDTVTVIYTALGVQATAKVIRVEWDALNDRYSKIVLGDAKSSFAETVIKPVEQQIAQMPTTSMMQAAIDHATALITGGLGSHFVISQTGSDPGEILFMDTTDPATAVHVLRINVNGIGFSSSGVNGPYTSAWTLDGHFVADFITAGTMLANRIQGGTLTLGGADNGNGTLVVKDANGNTIATINNAGVDIDKGVIDLGNGAFLVDNAGNLTANRANLTGKIRSEHEGFWMEIEDGKLSAGYNTNSFGSLNLVQRLGGFGVELKSSTHELSLWGDDVKVTRGRDNNQNGSVVITPSDNNNTRVRNIYVTDIGGGGKGLAVQDGNGTYYWAQLNAWS